MNAHRAISRNNGGLLAALLFAVPITFLCTTQAPAQQTSVATEMPLRIAAGPAAEPMFAVAGIIASVVSNPPGGPACAAGRICGYAGLVGEARATLDGMANLDALAAGQVETAIVEGDLLWQASNGFGPFAGRPLGDLRALSVLYTESVLLVVRADSPIAGIADLRQHTVSIGPLGNPHLHTIQQILTGHGVRPRELTQVHLTADAAAAGLQYGDVDVAIVVAPSLPQAFRAVAESTPLRLLPVAPDAAAALTGYYPYMLPVDLGDLAEGRRRTPGIALAVLWVTTQRLPSPVGHAVVRSLLAPANRAALSTVLPSSSAIAPEDELTRSPIALHPGAARYYEEAAGVVR